MSDKEKNINGEEESFEDIFSSLREKYNLQPFGSEEKIEDTEEKQIFYNPSEDNEIDDFFKEAEEGYTALYEEVDAKIAGVDEEALKHEAEVLGVEYGVDDEPAKEEPMEFEDIYSDSSEGKDAVDVYSESESENIEEVSETEETAPVVTAEDLAQEIAEEEEISDKKKGSFLPK